MQQFIDLVPQELLDVSGAVFNSGKDAFTQPDAQLYLLGLNPGGRPEEHVEQTVRFHLRKALSRPANWCEHRDESWNGHPAGTTGMQPRMLHVLDRLGLDPGKVPSSNIVFERTRGENDLAARWRALAERCWPVHAAVIQELKIRTVVCFGQMAGGFVCQQLAADRLLGSFEENNKRRLVSRVFENSAGVAVIVATHPSRFAWNSPSSDPSEFFRAVINRTSGEQLNGHWISANEKIVRPPQPSIVAAQVRLARCSAQPAPPDAHRDAALAEIFLRSGLGKVLIRNRKQAKDPSFSKLFVLPNDFRIQSLELYTTGAGKFRVHYAPDAPVWFKAALRALPGAKNPTDHGTDFAGDALDAARAIARVLNARRGPPTHN